MFTEVQKKALGVWLRVFSWRGVDIFFAPRTGSQCAQPEAEGCRQKHLHTAHLRRVIGSMRAQHHKAFVNQERGCICEFMCVPVFRETSLFVVQRFSSSGVVVPRMSVHVQSVALRETTLGGMNTSTANTSIEAHVSSCGPYAGR